MGVVFIARVVGLACVPGGVPGGKEGAVFRTSDPLPGTLRGSVAGAEPAVALELVLDERVLRGRCDGGQVALDAVESLGCGGSIRRRPRDAVRDAARYELVEVPVGREGELRPDAESHVTWGRSRVLAVVVEYHLAERLLVVRRRRRAANR